MRCVALILFLSSPFTFSLFSKNKENEKKTENLDVSPDTRPMRNFPKLEICSLPEPTVEFVNLSSNDESVSAEQPEKAVSIKGRVPKLEVDVFPEASVEYFENGHLAKRDHMADYARAKEKLGRIFAGGIRVGEPKNREDQLSSDVGTDFRVRYLVQREGEWSSAPSEREAKTRNELQDDKYMNEWLVRMTGGEEVAREMTEELGYKLVGQVKGFADTFIVSHRFDHHVEKRETKEVTNLLNEHVKVVWAQQQVARKRVRRGNVLRDDEDEMSFVKRARAMEHLFNDELWKHQWYLFDTRTKPGLPELDLRVIPVWESGITGNGVQILVVDDGLEWRHKDIVDNYVPEISYDFNDDDEDPTPKVDEMGSNSHGTRCGGEIVMQPNNSKCGVGISFGAKIGGARTLDGDVTDRIEGESLGWGISHEVDIVSCSWGPLDDGTVVEGPGILTKEALERGVTEGRNGRGILFVWASGNGGGYYDNCNCDGYASSIYTISIGSASESGRSPWYGEHCSSTLASAYSSGAYTDQRIVTTDLNDQCTIDFSGTSAAAPLGAGILALALEANNNLTWRDVQYALVLTSRWQPLSQEEGWMVNSRGLKFNPRFGFGLLSAEDLVRSLQNWTSVPEKLICKLDIDVGPTNIIKSGESLRFQVAAECRPTVLFLEHVQLLATIRHAKRGSLAISLTSPSGTTTDLLTPRRNDQSGEGFRDWPFMSVHTWGENPSGEWAVTVNDTSDGGDGGFVDALQLVLHGTRSPPKVYDYLIAK